MVNYLHWFISFFSGSDAIRNAVMSRGHQLAYIKNCLDKALQHATWCCFILNLDVVHMEPTYYRE